MKKPLAKLLCAVFIITSVLLLELGLPVPGLGEEFRGGILTANVNLRKAPNLRGNIVSGLLQGAPVKIYEEKDGWYRVSTQKYHQVFNGWVSIEYVKIGVVETTATPPGTKKPEPDPRVQLPPTVEKSPPPEAKAPAISPEPEPTKRAAATPPKTKIVDTKIEQPARVAKTPEPEPAKRAVATPPKTEIADTKTKRPPRVAKTPAPDAGTEPADDLIRLLPTALPVLGVIVLLIVGIVYRVRRASGPKAEEPDLSSESAPVVWPPPAAKDSPAIEDSPAAEDSPAVENSPVAENSLEVEENEPIDEDLSADFEFQMESLSADRTSGDDGDSPTEVVSVSGDGDSPTEVASVSDDGDKLTEDVSVYDQVMEKINRMSDVELVELLDLVDDQVGETPRKDNRLTFYTTVDYVVEGQYYRDFIQDLSVSGVFIKTRQMFEPGQHILMTFMSPFLQKPFKISGEIVRTMSTGIGVNFEKESQVQTEAISALLDQIRMVAESG